MFKNESCNDDMIDILTELHGRDQLTEERACNARQGRADGDSDSERLEGFIPKVEE